MELLTGVRGLRIGKKRRTASRGQSVGIGSPFVASDRNNPHPRLKVLPLPEGEELSAPGFGGDVSVEHFQSGGNFVAIWKSSDIIVFRFRSQRMCMSRAAGKVLFRSLFG